ncbi:MAG: TerC family protein [Myxococcota bacterium]
MAFETVGSPTLWLLFGAFITAMLVLDLRVFHRRAHAVTSREAATWSAVWIALALAFNGLVWWHWGAEHAEAFFTGYVIEKALSVDNLFVFYAIFTAFQVPAAYQHRLLFWGVLGAIVLRLAMVLGGAALLHTFHAVVYVFGAVLVASGVKMLRRHQGAPHPERSRAFRLLRRIVPTTRGEHGSRLFAREDGVLKATPLFSVLLLVETTDVVFAVDSILAILAITDDPFIVFTSNIFAVLGLRSLYFLLANMAERFFYLQPGLALVLVFVGVKLAISEWVKIPVLVSLGTVVALLVGSVLASWVRTRRAARRHDDFPSGTAHPSGV